MASSNRALNIDILTNDKQTLAALKRMQREFKDLDGSIDRTSKTGMGMGNMLGGLALGAGAMFAVSEFEEAEQSARSTEAVIKSTGNAAEVSAEQQSKMVDELSRLAGIDDDIVNSGANMLRTFTSIKGENFGEALAASMDLAAFKGMDLASAAEQVGKALNDPVAGMGKLAKQGVVLSDVQKQQIRDFAAVGDIASAQGVILAELETEFGGQAEAMATSSGRMKVALGEAAESVGAILAPAMAVGADAAGAAAQAFGELPQPLQAATIGGLGLAYVGPKIADGFSSVRDTLSSVSDALSVGAEKAGAMRSKAGELAATVASSPGAMAVGAAGVGVLAAAYLKAQADAEGFEDNVKSLQQMIEQGMSPAEANAAKLANTLAGLDGGFGVLEGSSDDFRKNLDTLGYSASDVAELMKLPADEWKKLRDEIQSGDSDLMSDERWNLLDNIEMMREATAKATEQEKIRKDVTKELGVETEKTTEATKQSTEATTEAKEADETWFGVNRQQVETFTERLSLQEKINEETAEASALANSAAEAELALSSAHDSVQDAQLALAQARQEGNPEKIQRATDDLSSAMIRESEAAVTLAQKQAEAQGKTLSAGEAADIQRQKLLELMTQTGTTSTTIQTLVNKLNDAAREREIKIYTAASEERLKRIWYILASIKALSTEVGIGGSILSGSAGRAIQESEAYKNSQNGPGGNLRTSNARTGPRRSTPAGSMRRRGGNGDVFNIANVTMTPSSREWDAMRRKAEREQGRRMARGR